MNFVILTAISLGLVVALMTAVAVAARVTGRVAVVDVAWGLGFVVIAIASAVYGQHPLA